MASEENKSILLTFDVEDWFQVENFKRYIPFSSWDSYELRVEKNVNRLLESLDSFPHKPKATFFILGYIAEKLPNLVKSIHKNGHEIASHGMLHELCTDLSYTDLYQDLINSKDFLEQLIGHEIHGYRAPSFAINNETIKVIQEAGYSYDSSYNSFDMHDRYGTIDLPGKKNKGVYQISDNFFELPVSNLKFFNQVFPLGGGGYFRLIPVVLFKLGIKRVLENQDVFMFYSHPWEFDPKQPRVNQATLSYKFRHYINLHKTETKLNSILESFEKLEFIQCSKYLKL